LVINRLLPGWKAVTLAHSGKLPTLRILPIRGRNQGLMASQQWQLLFHTWHSFFKKKCSSSMVQKSRLGRKESKQSWSSFIIGSIGLSRVRVPGTILWRRGCGWFLAPPVW